jgi:hypothetical protein
LSRRGRPTTGSAIESVIPVSATASLAASTTRSLADDDQCASSRIGNAGQSRSRAASRGPDGAHAVRALGTRRAIAAIGTFDSARPPNPSATTGTPISPISPFPPLPPLADC